MKIIRAYSVEINEIERSTINGFLSQQNVIDEEVLEEMCEYMNKKATEAFNRGFEEAQRVEGEIRD